MQWYAIPDHLNRSQFDLHLKNIKIDIHDSMYCMYNVIIAPVRFNLIKMLIDISGGGDRRDGSSQTPYPAHMV